MKFHPQRLGAIYISTKCRHLIYNNSSINSCRTVTVHVKTLTSPEKSASTPTRTKFDVLMKAARSYEHFPDIYGEYLILMSDEVTDLTY